ncbi:MAG TPA: FHA domain-containing serine/threonine-protein kinase [Planctomycetota bacterium]|nr:FHA domain-containing serine/threonine-protein kinase [Planctomycetota bacterium]
MAWLIVETGNDKGRKVELPQDSPPIMAGRLKDCALMLSDSMASRNHFKVFYKGEVFLIEDLKSHNGTYLNRKKLEQAEPLHDGDRIMVGNSLISYREELGKSVGVHTGKTIGDYKIVKLLGVGGMGEVYEAHQKSLERRVAVKILAPELATDTETVDRMIREARNAGKLNHPNVVQVHDVGKADGIYYYSMELVTGGSIQDLITGGRRVEPPKAVKFLLQAAAGLAYAEKQGIVHCDIKPDNLMLAADETVRLADLGISKTLVDGKADQSEGVFGSPHYMSPEQAQGLPLTCKSDIYSLGVTAYRMLSGHLPFDGTTAREIMEHHVFDEPHSLRENAPFLPARLIEVVEKMLLKNPMQRYQSAKELIDDLTAVEKGLRDGHLPTIQQLKNRTSVRIKKRDDSEQRKLIGAAWALIGVGGLLVIAYAVYTNLSGGHTEREAEKLIQRADFLRAEKKVYEAKDLFERAIKQPDLTSEERVHVLAALKEITAAIESPDSEENKKVRREQALRMSEGTPQAMVTKLMALGAAGFAKDSEDVVSLKYRMSQLCSGEIEKILTKAQGQAGKGETLAAAGTLSQAPEYIAYAVQGAQKFSLPWNALKDKLAPKLPGLFAAVKKQCDGLAAEHKVDEALAALEPFRSAVTAFEISSEVEAYRSALEALKAPPAPAPAPAETPAK